MVHGRNRRAPEPPHCLIYAQVLAKTVRVVLLLSLFASSGTVAAAADEVASEDVDVDVASKGCLSGFCV